MALIAWPMAFRCDHCRRKRRLRVHRYWQMRFCSAACKEAYQRRLGEHTKVKMRRLFATTGGPQKLVA
jgi:hypothetical protein